MILNFRQLEIFRAVMIAKTICGAAELLHVSQPGISRSLKYIEMKLGIELFERRQNGMLPTPEALEIYREVEPLFARLSHLNDDITRIVETDSTFLQIGCAPSLAHYVLPELLSHAKQVMPDFVARIDTLSNEGLADYIVQRRGAFALSTYDPEHPLVQAEPSIIGQIQCIVHEAHPLAQLESVTMEQILHYDMVAYYDDTFIGKVLKEKFAELGLTPKVAVQVRFNDVACAMVEHGLGVGFAYDFAIKASLSPNLRIVPLTTQLRPIPVFLLRHQGYSFSNSIRKYYETVKEKLADT